MDFFGNLISAGANLLGGLLGQSSARSTAQQNIAEQMQFAQHGLSWKAADATAAQDKYGINRLALLGVPTNSFNNIVGSSDAAQGVASAGQDVGRAATAYLSKPSRADLLNEQLLQAKIDNVNADTVQKQAEASTIARRFAAPGTPPGVPIPPVDPRRVNWDVHNAKPLEEWYVGRHGGMVSLPSAEASQAMQNWASMPAQLVVAGQGIGSNVDAAVQDLVPPFVWRGVDSSQYVPF